MNKSWNLDSLYPSFESHKFKSDMELLMQHTETLSRWVFGLVETDSNQAQVQRSIEDYLQTHNAYKGVYICLYSYAELVSNIDSSNTIALTILDEIAEKDSEIAESVASFAKWFGNLSHSDEIMANSAYLMNHEYYLKKLLRNTNVMQNEEVEKAVYKMQSTGSKAWQRLYMELVNHTYANIGGPEEEKQVLFSELKNMTYDADKAVRKAAYQAEMEISQRMSTTFAACINGISGEANTLSELRGYQNPLEKVLVESRMDVETLNVLLEAIKENLDVFHEYFGIKARLLGHETGLPYYDIFAPIGRENIKISFLEAQYLIISAFSTFDKELSDFATKVFDNQWIDAEPREGKGGYGMSVDIFPIQESRIMTTFTGNYADVIVLAHEIGHAYHSSCLGHQTMLNTDYPVPIAETASIFCETIMNNSLIEQLSAEDYIDVAEKRIADSAYYVVEMYARYLFEIRLYEHRKQGALSVEQLNELMIGALKEAYGDNIDIASLNPYMWGCKLGYFLSGNEFCNFPYTFGVLFSKGLYSEYLQKKEGFAALYKKFLGISSTNDIVELSKTINIDVHSVEFWKNALKLIKKDVELLSLYR